MLEVRLLGQFDLRLDGQPLDMPSRPAQSLLAYLMVNAGIAYRREKLAGLLWPETPEDVAVRNLRQVLYTLRKTIEPGRDGSLLLADEISVSFNRNAPYWLDVSGFANDITDKAAIDRLVEVLDAYGGELLPGFYDEWVILERERLEVAFDQRMRLLLDRLVEAQRWPETIEWAERWIALGHAPEPAYRAEMVAYWGLDDLAGMATSFRRCEETLARELGVRPSDKTVALYDRLAKGLPPKGTPSALQGSGPASPGLLDGQAASGRVATLPAEPGECPFKGLQFFAEDDAHLFFGREELTGRLLELIDGCATPRGTEAPGSAPDHSGQVIVVVGASGSGKSSLVRAGLMPALRAEAASGGAGSPAIFLLTPHMHPLESLAACLVGQPGRSRRWCGLLDSMAKDPMALARYLNERAAAGLVPLVLIVDQLEELFTMCRVESERRSFLDNLMAAARAGAARVVLALRADYYGHCGAHEGLRAALTRYQLYVGPMSAREMRRAIEQPAVLNGWDYEPGLVDLILRDAGAGPGALPLLSHALLETWNRRSGRTLTLQGYAEAHGVRGAIARTADAVYNSLTPRQQVLAKGVLLRLSEPGEGAEDTRRSASFDELLAQSWDRAELDDVLDILIEARLISVSQGTVGVAHEALIREWGTLRAWLDEDREGLKLRRRLTESAQAWDAQQRDPSELYRGARLAQALEWSAKHTVDLNALEQAFLDASSAWANREAAEREAQRQREVENARMLAEAEAQRLTLQKRTSRRLLGLAIGLAILLVLSMTLGAFAWRQQQRVQQQAQIAASRYLASSAMSFLRADPQRSILLAMEAERTADTTEARQSLHSAILASPALAVAPLQMEPLDTSVFSPDGTLFALMGTTTENQTVTEVYEVSSGRRLLVLPGGLAASTWPDAARLTTLQPVSGGATRLARWEIPSGRALSTTLATFNMTRTRTILSWDEQSAVVLGSDGAVDLWNAATGQHASTIRTAGGEGASRAAISPNGFHLLFFRGQQGFMLGLPEGKLEYTMTVNELTHVLWAPCGSCFALADEGRVSIYDAYYGVRHNALPQTQTSYVRHLAYAGDGIRLATAADDGTVKIWDVDSGEELLNLPGHQGGVVGLAFAPNGDRLATVGLDRTLRFWNVTPDRVSEAWTFFRAKDGSALTALAVNADGSRLAATSEHGFVQVWDVPDGEPMLVAQDGAGDQGAVAFSPDGRLVASADGREGLRVRELPGGRRLFGEVGNNTTIGALAFRPDGRQVATLDYALRLRTWDADSGKLRWSTRPLPGFVGPRHKVGLAYSPDGARLVSAGGKAVSVWNAETGRVLLDLLGQTTAPTAVTFDPTGKQLAVGTIDGQAGIWDATTGDPLLGLSGHNGAIEAIAYSRDGDLLATGGADEVVKIWDTSSGEQMLSLPGHKGGVTGAVFTPDGKHLATTSRDGRLRIYALDPGELATIARSRLTRWWTAAECQKYLSGGKCPPEPK